MCRSTRAPTLAFERLSERCLFAGDLAWDSAHLPEGEGARSEQLLKIASGTEGAPGLATSAQFGTSVANLGDLDHDGINDLAVGAPGLGGGSVFVLFLQPDGSVKRFTQISSGHAGGPNLVNTDRFGASLAALGDLDQDGVTDLAVGAPGSRDFLGFGDDRGSVHVLFMRADGTVKSSTTIASQSQGGPFLSSGSQFGGALAMVPDLNGDGVTDLAVGSNSSTYVLFLGRDGRVSSYQQIFNFGGNSVTSVGDLDANGTSDLVISTPGMGDFGYLSVLFMASDGTVTSSTRIDRNSPAGPALGPNDYFGGSIANVGDINGDGIDDLAAGALLVDETFQLEPAVFTILLKRDGTTQGSDILAYGGQKGYSPSSTDEFGLWVTSLGDLTGDGKQELAIGAPLDDTGASDAGAVYLTIPQTVADRVFLNLQPPLGVFVPGQQVTYQIDFRYQGTPTATTINVTDMLPANLEWVSQEIATGTGWSANHTVITGQDRIVFTKNGAVDGETARLIVVARVSSEVTASELISNSVTATSDRADLDLSRANDRETIHVDALPPSSHVMTLPTESATPFAVNWEGTDDLNGSGIRSFDIFVSENGAPYSLWLDDTFLSGSLFPGVAGNSYRFFSVAEDLAGHVEQAPEVDDARTEAVLPRFAWHNASDPLDVNRDGTASPIDVLLIINELNSGNYHDPITGLFTWIPDASTPSFDVTNDNFVSPMDALTIINFINGQASGEGESSEHLDGGSGSFQSQQPLESSENLMEVFALLADDVDPRRSEIDTDPLPMSWEEAARNYWGS